ncbi:dockerin type I domain-containing protein [Amedibacillus dolichus]|nr:dockerin type I domain-containing protein [Amedibacillus dolichus]MCG4879938.1 dockerin type I domain-containing protein [Amedibacillus dolichus]
MTFTLKENGVLTTYTVVIKGDVDGDGQIRSIDYSIVKNDILNIRKLSKAYATAGDVDGDGKIRSIDYSLIKNDILNIKDIVQ